MGQDVVAQLHGAVVKPSSAEALQWARITNSLLLCIQQLDAWGEQLINAALSPDISTVTETANALADLERELQKLDIWIDTQPVMQHWTMLQQGIRVALQQYQQAPTVGKLRIYLKWLGERNRDRFSPNQQANFEDQGAQAAREMIRFAAHLKSAVDIGIMTRKRQS